MPLSLSLSLSLSLCARSRGRASAALRDDRDCRGAWKTAADLPPALTLRRVSFLASSSDFVIEPSPWFSAWLLVLFVAAVITALKGRWGWLLVGCIFGGLLWLVSAWLAPRPGSCWARCRGSHRQSSPPVTVSSAPRMKS
jgi:hypothetical protein